MHIHSYYYATPFCHPTLAHVNCGNGRASMTYLRIALHTCDGCGGLSRDVVLLRALCLGSVPCWRGNRHVRFVHVRLSPSAQCPCARPHHRAERTSANNLEKRPTSQRSQSATSEGQSYGRTLRSAHLQLYPYKLLSALSLYRPSIYSPPEAFRRRRSITPSRFRLTVTVLGCSSPRDCRKIPSAVS
jgi:hypothetical protein